MTDIFILHGDITKVKIDAIVNAANRSLLGGGGVDGAIHRAAGPRLAIECLMLAGCKPGRAKVTKAYRLPARLVIHTVGPVWNGGNRGEPEVLASCYGSAFARARENGVTSISFPAISCGIYRYPVEQAAEIAIRETREALSRPSALTEVIFVCFDRDVFESYQRRLG